MPMKILQRIILMHLAVGMCMGQGTTFQEQAERLQNINAFLLDFRPNAAPIPAERSHLEAILDINPQPTINTRIGRKDEPVDPPSVVPKLRGRYLFSNGLFLGAAFAPGIEFQDYTAEYISAELGYRFQLNSWGLGLRASFTDGDLEGPITETDVEDMFTFTNYGGDLSLGHSLGPVYLYGFGGWNDVDTTLDIEEDGARLSFTDNTYYYGGGVSYSHGRWRLNLEQNVTDDYLQHLTLSLSFRF